MFNTVSHTFYNQFNWQFENFGLVYKYQEGNKFYAVPNEKDCCKENVIQPNPNKKSVVFFSLQKNYADEDNCGATWHAVLRMYVWYNKCLFNTKGTIWAWLQQGIKLKSFDADTLEFDQVEGTVTVQNPCVIDFKPCVNWDYAVDDTGLLFNHPYESFYLDIEFTYCSNLNIQWEDTCTCCS